MFVKQLCMGLHAEVEVPAVTVGKRIRRLVGPTCFSLSMSRSISMSCSISISRPISISRSFSPSLVRFHSFAFFRCLFIRLSSCCFFLSRSRSLSFARSRSHSRFCSCCRSRSLSNSHSLSSSSFSSLPTLSPSPSSVTRRLSTSPAFLFACIMSGHHLVPLKLETSRCFM